VPIEVRLAAGTAVDAAQVVLRAGDGYRVVNAEGRPADRDSVIAQATASPLPVILRQAVDAVSGLVELAFGRQIGQGTGGATGEGRLGTILVKVPDSPTAIPGPALTIVPAGRGGFTSVTVGSDGMQIGASEVSVWVTVDEAVTVGEAIDLGPSGGSVDPIIGPPAPVGAVPAGTGVARVPVTPGPTASGPLDSGPRASGPLDSGPRASGPLDSGPRASGPLDSGPRASGPLDSGPRASLPASRLVTEDPARGTITVNVPGRAAPIELKAGFATTAPDAYCPVARHRTYIRLQDVGIAGATFGVEPGGVLAWVTPDQAGCVDWGAIDAGNLTFTKEAIMQFELARAAPGALLWVLGGARDRELYEVDATGTARYVTAEAFATNRDHFAEAWANVIPVSSAQIDRLILRGVAWR
jgi:hypothetical protein